MAGKKGPTPHQGESERPSGPNEFPRRLGERLWVLGNSYFNLYLVKGDNSTALIELGVSAVVDDVIGQLESLQTTPDLLLMTHPHADHVTGLEGLRARFSAALTVTGKGAPEFLARPKAAEGLVVEDRHMWEFLASQGFWPGRPPVESPPDLGVYEELEDGREIDLGAVTLRIISVKGHAPGSVNVHVHELETVIASDTLGFRFATRGFLPLFFTSFSDWTAALDRVEATAPKIVGVAHQGPLMGSQVGEFLTQARRITFEMRDRFAKDPRSTEEVAQELFDQWYCEEFLLYTPENILNCFRLLVKRARESAAGDSA